jgi:hypothetical protein
MKQVLHMHFIAFFNRILPSGCLSSLMARELRAYKMHWSFRVPALTSQPAKQYAFPVIEPAMSVQWKRVCDSWAAVRGGMDPVSLTAAVSCASV